jgi:predicted dehydrogenase
MMTTRLGIIGLGGWSRQILQAVDQLPDVKITHCYSRHSDTRQTFAAEYDCVACETYEHMLGDPQIEAVVVMSANTAHEEDVILAASRGKHIFVTKPIATTVDAAQRMINACSKNDVILAVGHQTRREPALRKLKEVLDSEELGTVRLVEANYSTPNGLKIKQGDWRWAREECPGGALIQIGIHVIDTLQYLMGPIKRVFSQQDRGGLSVDMPGITTTLLDFESGLQGYLGATYVSRFSHWIKVYGTRKNALYSELGGLTLTEDSWEQGQIREQIAPSANVHAPMPTIVEEMEEFARCIRTGASPEIGGQAAMHNLAVVLAAVESDASGKSVEITSIIHESEVSCCRPFARASEPMKQFDIRDILSEARKVVCAHAGTAPGEYHRILKPTKDMGSRTGVTAYGCADAACILYTLDELPVDAAERQAWIGAIQRFQNPETGLFEDGSHHEIHTTAFALGALDFFDARAAHPLTALHALKEREQMEHFLDNLQWHEEPWLDSHQGAGIYSALVMNREVSREWENWYFDWLWEQEDPATGFWRKGEVTPLENKEAPVPLFHYLGGSFHYLFNLVYARRLQRFPEKAIDTCLEIWKNNHQPLYGEPFCKGISYAEIDWVFYLNRSVRQCGYRFEESRKAIEEAAEKYITHLKQIDYSHDTAFNDLHKLFGMVCALSEFQLALPGQLVTKRPLRQVLDRRPYI